VHYRHLGVEPRGRKFNNMELEIKLLLVYSRHLDMEPSGRKFNIMELIIKILFVYWASGHGSKLEAVQLHSKVQ
jgi:hypothetical protein